MIFISKTDERASNRITNFKISRKRKEILHRKLKKRAQRGPRVFRTRKPRTNENRGLKAGSCSRGFGARRGEIVSSAPRITRQTFYGLYFTEPSYVSLGTHPRVFLHVWLRFACTVSKKTRARQLSTPPPLSASASGRGAAR